MPTATARGGTPLAGAVVDAELDPGLVEGHLLQHVVEERQHRHPSLVVLWQPTPRHHRRQKHIKLLSKLEIKYDAIYGIYLK